MFVPSFTYFIGNAAMDWVHLRIKRLSRVCSLFYTSGACPSFIYVMGKADSGLRLFRIVRYSHNFGFSNLQSQPIVLYFTGEECGAPFKIFFNDKFK